MALDRSRQATMDGKQKALIGLLIIALSIQIMSVQASVSAEILKVLNFLII